MIATPEPFGRVGRLGNQLLQLAATVGLAYRVGDAPLIPADWPYRDVYRIPEHWFEDRNAIASMVEAGHAIRADDLPHAQHLPEWVRPYLQDPALWLDYDSSIRGLFTLDTAALATVSAAWRSLGIDGRVCGVHVRRGDNVTNEPGTINLLPESYYRDALARVDYDELVICTDDPDWCAEHFADLDPHIYRGVPRSKEQTPEFATEEAVDWIDLAVLASCDRVICSNSTYAWWGAFLSSDPAPLYPSYWVGHQLVERGQDPELLFPERLGWHCVECRGVCEVQHHGDRVVGRWEDGVSEPLTFTVPFESQPHDPETVEWSAMHCAYLLEQLTEVPTV